MAYIAIIQQHDAHITRNPQRLADINGSSTASHIHMHPMLLTAIVSGFAPVRNTVMSGLTIRLLTHDTGAVGTTCGASVSILRSVSRSVWSVDVEVSSVVSMWAGGVVDVEDGSVEGKGRREGLDLQRSDMYMHAYQTKNVHTQMHQRHTAYIMLYRSRSRRHAQHSMSMHSHPLLT